MDSQDSSVSPAKNRNCQRYEARQLQLYIARCLDDGTLTAIFD